MNICRKCGGVDMIGDGRVGVVAVASSDMGRS